MKFRRKRFKRQVRWLPDNSWNLNLQGQPIQAPWAAVHGSMDLLDIAGGMPTQFLQPGTTGWPNNFLRERDSALIIDHIQGKIHWGWEGASGLEGSTDADGTFVLSVRCAIWIAAVNPTIDGSSVGGIQVQTGEILSDETILNPGASNAPMQAGSFAVEGFRCLWRRTFVTVNEFKADVADGWVGSEDCCPPGPYVDIKPRRILKGNEVLKFGWWVNVAPGVAADGSLRFWMAQPDIRVAAHNTYRRR